MSVNYASINSVTPLMFHRLKGGICLRRRVDSTPYRERLNASFQYQRLHENYNGDCSDYRRSGQQSRVVHYYVSAAKAFGEITMARCLKNKS